MNVCVCSCVHDEGKVQQKGLRCLITGLAYFWLRGSNTLALLWDHHSKKRENIFQLVKVIKMYSSSNDHQLKLIRSWSWQMGAKTLTSTSVNDFGHRILWIHVSGGSLWQIVGHLLIGSLWLWCLNLSALLIVTPSISGIDISSSLGLHNDTILQEAVLIIAHDSIARPDGNIEVISLDAIFLCVEWNEKEAEQVGLDYSLSE